MAIDGFDYEGFSESMFEDSKSLIPADIQGESRDYIANTLKNFSLLAGEALNNDETIDIDAEQAEFITQIIAEWAFHKSVDLAHSQIPKEYWDAIMQRIAFTVFEVAKQGIIREIEQTDLIQAVEYHVNKCWDEMLEEMVKDEKIQEETFEHAKNLSNIDEMAEEIKQEERKTELETFVEKQKKSTDFTSENLVKSMNNMAFQCALAVDDTIRAAKNIINTKTAVFLGIITAVLLFYFTGWYKSEKALMYFIIIANIAWIIFKTVENYLNQEVETQLNQLEQIRKDMQDLVNPDRMYERLGVDVLSIQVAENLLPIADPDEEGQLLPKTAALRQRMTDKLGYILPNIRIMDNSTFEDYEFRIFVRKTEVLKGYVYPDKYMVVAEQFDKTGKSLPDDCIVSLDPCYSTQVYWIEKKDIPNGVTAVSAVDVIITAMEKTSIEHVEEIISVKDVEKYLDLCYDDIGGTDIYERLVIDLTRSDIKAIFCNLIKEKVSIKDIIRVFELISKYVKKNPNPDYISEKIRENFGAKIFLQNLEENKTVLFGLKYSQKWLDRLFLAYGCNEEGDYEFHFTEPQQKDILESTADKLMEIYRQVSQQPVVVCPSKIRLALYRFLVKHIPSIVMMSYEEFEQCPQNYQKEEFIIE